MCKKIMAILRYKYLLDWPFDVLQLHVYYSVKYCDTKSLAIPNLAIPKKAT